MTSGEGATFEERVERAFASVPYPGDDDIVVDQSGYDLECMDILEKFRSRTWGSISEEEVLLHKESLPLFTPRAFRYYLPAYLIACAKHRRELGVAAHNLAFALTPPEEMESGLDFFLSRARLFEPEQGHVMLEYLELTADIERTGWATMGMASPLLAGLERAIAWWKARLGGA